MKNSETKDFVAYEYLSMNVKSDQEPLYIDCYENFGWTVVNHTALVDKDDYYLNHSYINGNRLVNIKFKRDRRIKKKAELLSLQRKLEGSLKEIERLENEPNATSIAWAMGFGLVGTIFLAISVFSITAENPIYFLGILTGVIGIVGWILPYFVYKKIKMDVEKENITLIDEEYNTIYDVCEQAKKLID